MSPIPGHLCPQKAAHCLPAQWICSQPLRLNSRMLWIGFFSARRQPPGLRRGGCVCLGSQGIAVAGTHWISCNCKRVMSWYWTRVANRPHCEQCEMPPLSCQAPDRPSPLHRASLPHAPRHTRSPSPPWSQALLRARWLKGRMLGPFPGAAYPQELREAPQLQWLPWSELEG